MARLFWQFALVLLLIPGSSGASDKAALEGIWGSPAQCARALLVEGGSKTAEPFEIRDGWLRHGQTWCHIKLFRTDKETVSDKLCRNEISVQISSMGHTGFQFPY